MGAEDPEVDWRWSAHYGMALDEKQREGQNGRHVERETEKEREKEGRRGEMWCI